MTKAKLSMRVSQRTRVGLVVREIFGILVDHPDGLFAGELMQRLQRSSTIGHITAARSFSEVSFCCVAPIRAGWLVVERGRWQLSTEGRAAYRQFEDANELIMQAGSRSHRGWLSANFPRSYRAAGAAKDQITSEFKAARRIGFRSLLGLSMGRMSQWQSVLPLQAPRTVEIAGGGLATSESLISHLTDAGLRYADGGHTVYLPPESVRDSVFAEAASAYPSDAGLKIVKTPGGIQEGRYVTIATKGDSRLHLSLTHDHRRLTLVANLLRVCNLGPRLYDLLELRCGDRAWTAYMVEHVAGPSPSLENCKAGVNHLRDLDNQGILKVTLPDGFADPDFDCPGCGGNALSDSDGDFRYVDFQNFLLADYESFLTPLAVEAAKTAHFGDTSLLRGGRYLYQSIPGVRLSAKRDVAKRMTVFLRLLASCGASLKDRLVLDVGCNIGGMMGQYLKNGARWCHGWDRPHVVPHTERLLLALGCTRFSTSGADIHQGQPLGADLPAFARRHLHGCVISYLAVRGHLGWLHELATLPWSILIYEGHEDERRTDTEKYLSELHRLVPFEVAGLESYVDGDSEERVVAILTRRPG